MKEIKAYVHRHCVADVIEAIKTTKAWTIHQGGSGQHHLAVMSVQGTLQPLDNAERHYPINLGMEVVHEFLLALHCDDECVDELVDAIRASGKTGQRNAGWIFVTNVVTAQEIQ